MVQFGYATYPMYAQPQAQMYGGFSQQQQPYIGGGRFTQQAMPMALPQYDRPVPQPFNQLSLNDLAALEGLDLNQLGGGAPQRQFSPFGSMIRMALMVGTGFVGWKLFKNWRLNSKVAELAGRGAKEISHAGEAALKTGESMAHNFTGGLRMSVIDDAVTLAHKGKAMTTTVGERGIHYFTDGAGKVYAASPGIGMFSKQRLLQLTGDAAAAAKVEIKNLAQASV